MSTSLQPPQRPAPDDAGPHILDNAAWAALNGPHRHLAEIVGSAARYRPGLAPFTALADADDPRSWADLATLVGPGGTGALAGVPEPPDGWRIVESGQGVQLVAETLRDEPDAEARLLAAEDVPEMLDLVARTKPGPFMPGTIELGAYYGIHRDGRLVAMAGERLRPPGFTEISAVCTDVAHRGQGLATRLVRHVAAGIRERGDTPFLHASAVNAGAIRLYESIGFRLRRSTLFYFVRAPEGAAGEVAGGA